uniref:Uncharacterized protein n=1 Tax=Anguilla anguilla TaxID=7936 RepID=A0A0E9XGK6_ANGAN
MASVQTQPRRLEDKRLHSSVLFRALFLELHLHVFCVHVVPSNERGLPSLCSLCF